jgi:predicted DNA-binding protein (UPF0251 family)
MQNTISQEEALDLIRRLVESEGSNTKAAARLDISSGYLSEILSSDRPISDKVARKLGYERVVVYKPLDKKGKDNERK